MLSLNGFVLGLRGKSKNDVLLETKAFEFSVLLSCAVLAKPTTHERTALFDEIRPSLVEMGDGKSIPNIERMVSQFDTSFTLSDLSLDDKKAFFHNVWLHVSEFAKNDEDCQFVMLDKLPENDRLSTLLVLSRSEINQVRGLVEELIIKNPEGVIPRIESTNPKSAGKEL